MTGSAEPAARGGVETLERSIAYAHASLQLVSQDALGNSTPCRGWDLRDLLAHMADSLVALSEAAEVGRVDLDPTELTGRFADDIVHILRRRACRLLGAWTNAGLAPVAVGDRMLTGRIVTGAGALEIAVHSWDVAQACGRDRPIPAGLASELLELAPALVGADDRPARFADPVQVTPLARPSDLLIAYLGRSPVTAHRPRG